MAGARSSFTRPEQPESQGRPANLPRTNHGNPWYSKTPGCLAYRARGGLRGTIRISCEPRSGALAGDGIARGRSELRLLHGQLHSRAKSMSPRHLWQRHRGIGPRTKTLKFSIHLRASPPPPPRAPPAFLAFPIHPMVSTVRGAVHADLPAGCPVGRETVLVPFRPGRRAAGRRPRLLFRLPGSFALW